MKTLILSLIITLLTPVSLSNTEHIRPSLNQVELNFEKKEQKTFYDESKQYHKYMQKIAKFESNNNPNIVNTYGYIGKYQFGKSALKHLNININTKEFKENPAIWSEFEQDKAMFRLIQENKRLLKHEIKRYANKTVNGIYVTEEGLLGAAHLGGAGSVKKWIYNNETFQDGYGTPITKLIKMFS